LPFPAGRRRSALHRRDDQAALRPRHQGAERKALSDEVDDVFKIAQKQVEHDGFHEAIISSNQVLHGIILTSNRTLNFIFERGADGNWTRIGRSEFMAVQ
jgi:hypothetical protein